MVRSDSRETLKDTSESDHFRYVADETTNLIKISYFKKKIFDLGLVCSQQWLTFEEMAERDLNKT